MGITLVITCKLLPENPERRLLAALILNVCVCKLGTTLENCGEHIKQGSGLRRMLEVGRSDPTHLASRSSISYI